MAWWQLQIPWDEMHRQNAAFDYFERAFMATGGPVSAALLSRRSEEGVEYVGTDGGNPVIGVALKAAGFTETSRPANAEGLGLVIGHTDARERLFPA
jgi:hypothetical protein